MVMGMIYRTGVLWQLSLLAFEFEIDNYITGIALNLGALLAFSIISCCLCLHVIDNYNFSGLQSFDHSY